MGISQHVIEYIKVLAWPVLVISLALLFKGVISRLIPGSKVKFKIAGVSIETSIPELEKSVTESLRGRKLTSEQWSWLRQLRDDGRSKYNHEYYAQLRLLRNAGLIREHPEGWLSSADEVEITTLGFLLLEAYDKSDP